MARLELRDVRTHRVGPLSLALDPGECVALWGPSGSGKTVLLRAVADLDPHAGQVELDGLEQAAMTGPAWRRRVGYLAAESGWWAPRVGDHFADGEQSRRRELESLRLPAGCFDWQIERLSSGERQRLALLRLLAAEPEALLLDEPTANLDPESGAAVEGLIAAYRERREAPVIWVSHDAAQRARVAGRELLLDS